MFAEDYSKIFMEICKIKQKIYEDTFAGWNIHALIVAFLWL